MSADWGKLLAQGAVARFKNALAKEYEHGASICALCETYMVESALVLDAIKSCGVKLRPEDDYQVSEDAEGWL